MSEAMKRGAYVDDTENEPILGAHGEIATTSVSVNRHIHSSINK